MLKFANVVNITNTPTMMLSCLKVVDLPNEEISENLFSWAYFSLSLLLNLTFLFLLGDDFSFLRISRAVTKAKNKGKLKL